MCLQHLLSPYRKQRIGKEIRRQGGSILLWIFKAAWALQHQENSAVEQSITSSPQCSLPALHGSPDARPSVSALVRSMISSSLMTVTPRFTFVSQPKAYLPVDPWSQHSIGNWGHPETLIEIVTDIIQSTIFPPWSFTQHVANAPTFLVQPPVEYVAFLPL